MEKTPIFDAMLTQLKRSRKPGSKELVRLFEKNRADVAKHFETCIPDLRGKDYWKWGPEHCTLQEFHGPMFHKGFRQYDVCGDKGADDSAIWQLLGRSTEHTFWKCHHDALEPLQCKAKQLGRRQSRSSTRA